MEESVDKWYALYRKRNDQTIAETITLSEYIAKLQAALAEYGDLPVVKHDEGCEFSICADDKIETHDLNTSRGDIKVARL